MKGLLIKDFRIIFSQKRFFLLLIFIAVMLNFNSSGSFVIGYLTFVCSVFTLNTISYDENENGYSFLMTLPFLRKIYALEKYVFGLLISSGAWVISVILAFVYEVYSKHSFVMPDFFINAAIFIPLFVVLISIMLPFQFKFGSEKGRIAMVMAFGIVFFAVYFTVKAFEKVGIDVEKIIDNLSVMHQSMLLLIAFIVSVLLLVSSIAVSVHIIKNKEF